MHRRNFLKMVSTIGSVVPVWALTPAAFAQSAPSYSGKILVNVFAGGGLDQSSWTDPRESNRSINAYAGVTPAGVAGNIRYAPMGNNKSFFDKYYRQMLVINGINSESNSHNDSLRAHNTGTLGRGFPNFAELFASSQGAGLPLPWLNSVNLFSGEGLTSGLLPPSSVPSPDTFRAMAQPNAASATTDLMNRADVARMQQVRLERMQALKASGGMLPRTQQVVDQFVAAGQTRGALSRLESIVPATFDRQTSTHIALLCAAAGFTSAVQVGTGRFTFDTHEDHPNRMANALPQLTDMVDYIWQKSAELGISNRIFVRIFSDFGRIGLNNNNGKDHWSIGSQVFMEAAPAWGNRVFGASDPVHKQLKIGLNGAVDPTNGIVIRPRHVHKALRQYLGMSTTDPRFDLKVPASESFDFFNPATRTGYPTA